jgi:hypothetical protein
MYIIFFHFDKIRNAPKKEEEQNRFVDAPAVNIKKASHYNSKYQKSSQYLKVWWQLNIWPKLIVQGA